MTSEGLGEMFEGDSADMCAGKFPLVLMWAERRVSRAQTRERGTPSALAEISPFVFWIIGKFTNTKCFNNQTPSLKYSSKIW